MPLPKEAEVMVVSLFPHKLSFIGNNSCLVVRQYQSHFVVDVFQGSGNQGLPYIYEVIGHFCSCPRTSLTRMGESQN
jgi:hypothetical protein